MNRQQGRVIMQRPSQEHARISRVCQSRSQINPRGRSGSVTDITQQDDEIYPKPGDMTR